MNPLYTLLDHIAAGRHDEADEIFTNLVGERITEILDGVKEQMAQDLFASTEGEVIEESTDLQELSTETLNSYKKKANKSAMNAAGKLLAAERKGGSTEKHLKKMTKRVDGIAKAKEKILDRKLKVSESIDLQELSKKTLGSYVRKAASDAFGAGHDAGAGKLGSVKSMKGYEKGTKRLAGIRKATSKMTNEEVESLQELSRKTLGKYIQKAKVSRDKAADAADAAFDNAERTNNLERMRGHLTRGRKSLAVKLKRKAGIATAQQKLRGMKEEVESLQELSSKTLDSYKSKASEQLGGSKAKKRLKGLVRADMQKRKAKKAEALGAAKKEMDGWKPDKKDVRKIYQKED